MPHAWYWLEAGGTAGFPWYRRVRTFGLEPASSYPGAGLAAAVDNSSALRLQPGESRTATVCLTVMAGSSG